jgi:DICT domain-containing protein
MSGFSFDNDDYPETVTPREAADRLHQAGNPNAAAYLLSLPHSYSVKLPLPDFYPATMTHREFAMRLHQAGNSDAAAYLLSLPDDHPFTAERTQVTMAQQAKVSQLPAWQQREVYKRRNDFCDTRYIP